MWLFTRYGFFSVSVDRLGNLAVRARAKRHLVALQRRFGKLKRTAIIYTEKADYHYRIVVHQDVWAEIVEMMVNEQTWGNFKKEADAFQKDPIYKHSLYRIWFEMVQAQEEWEEVML